MNGKNELKLLNVKKEFDKRNIIYNELKNGQLQIDGINYWSTSGKFYNPKNGFKGNGMNSFLKYLKEENII